jgi:hypothetical protein
VTDETIRADPRDSLDARLAIELYGPDLIVIVRTWLQPCKPLQTQIECP